MQFCVDYQCLNSVAQYDAYPMPHVDELIDRLGNAQYISTLDLARGYWQAPGSYALALHQHASHHNYYWISGPLHPGIILVIKHRHTACTCIETRKSCH